MKANKIKKAALRAALCGVLNATNAEAERFGDYIAEAIGDIINNSGDAACPRYCGYINSRIESLIQALEKAKI